jgi:hypothetical protein
MCARAGGKIEFYAASSLHALGSQRRNPHPFFRALNLQRLRHKLAEWCARLKLNFSILHSAGILSPPKVNSPMDDIHAQATE